MSRYRRGGKNRRQQADRPASVVHRQLLNSTGRLSHWYNHKPVVTVDQLHFYRRKGFGAAVSSSPRPPISLSASPSFDTEYSCRYEPPYRTAEEMSVNRRHAAVPKDELQVEGDAEFSAEYAEQFKDMPRERNFAARQGSHIGPFVCADNAAQEGIGSSSEQHDRYVPHPDGRRADNLRPSTGLRMDEAPMDGETEQMANYRKYPTTPHPDKVADRNEGTASAKDSKCSAAALRPFDSSIKEMVLTRDSGMLLRPAHSFAVVGGPRIERAGSVRMPAFRLEVVDRCGGSATRGAASDAFLVLDNNNILAYRSHATHNNNNYYLSAAAAKIVGGGGGGQDRAGTARGHNNNNRWVKSRQRKMGTARFLGDRRALLRDADTGGR